MPILMNREDLSGSVDWQNRQIVLPSLSRSDPREDARRLAMGGYGAAALERFFSQSQHPQPKNY